MPPPGAAPQGGDDDGPGIKPQELIAFVLSSARRHRAASYLVGFLAILLGLLVATAVPSVYQSTCKLHLMQSSRQLTTALASGRREDPYSALKGVSEAVLNRDNLIAIIRESNLAERWEASRSWPLRLKDQLMTTLLGPPTQESVERALLDLVEKSVGVGIEDVASVRFTVAWRDAESAYLLTSLMQRNFLQARTSDEAQAIARAITILEDQLKRSDEPVASALKEVQRVVAQAREKSLAATRKAGTAEPTERVPAPAPRATAAVQNDGGPRMSSADMAAKTASLQDVRREIREVIDPWQRYQAHQKNLLADMRATFGPEHPAVRQQLAKIAAASEEPPELAALRRKEANLAAELSAAEREPSGDSKVLRSSRLSRHSPGAAEAAMSITLLREEAEDPEVDAARARLVASLQKQDELLERLEGARIDFETTKTSTQYMVVEAPEKSRKPMKPKRALLYAGAVLFGLLVGVFYGALRELGTGRVVAPWQLNALGIAVVGEIKMEPPDRA
jgi:uncharacterized protein involved in exopolysaccharide biosynthesis